MQHDERKVGFPLLTSWLRLTWQGKRRNIGDPNAPLHDTVYRRFALPSVIHYDTVQPYRPEGLRRHAKLADYYKDIPGVTGRYCGSAQPAIDHQPQAVLGISNEAALHTTRVILPLDGQDVYRRSLTRGRPGDCPLAKRRTPAPSCCACGGRWCGFGADRRVESSSQDNAFRVPGATGRRGRDPTVMRPVAPATEALSRVDRVQKGSIDCPRRSLTAVASRGIACIGLSATIVSCRP